MDFIKKRIKAFGYAFSGLGAALKRETHLKIHVLAAVLVISAGFYFEISATQWLAVFICIGMVIGLELINSSIESLCDALMPEHNDKVKYIKDVAAAAVLVASLVALAVAALIFWPYAGVA